MSRRVLDIYIEFDLFDNRNEHFAKWLFGWFYLWRMQPKCVEVECDGCKWYRCSEYVTLGVTKVSVESSVNMFDFVLLFGFEFVRFMKTCKMGVKVMICEDAECVEMNIEDWEKLYEELI